MKIRSGYILIIVLSSTFSFAQQRDTAKAGTIKVKKIKEVQHDSIISQGSSIVVADWTTDNIPCSDTAVLSLKLSYLAANAIKEEKFNLKSVNTKCAKFPDEIIRSYVAGYKSKNAIADTCKIYVDEIKAVQRSTGKAVNLKAQVFKNKKKVS